MKSALRLAAWMIGVARQLAWIYLIGWVAQTTTKGFDFDEFLIVPLRVHLLSAEGESPLKTSLKEADIERIIPKINNVWAQAGIHFYVESLVKEEAVPGEIPDHPGKGPFLWLLSHIPRATQATNLFNLYFVKQFAVNGVYFHDAIFVKDTASLRPVSGGLDEPIPRVTAHELGHALSLLHRQNFTNLMASGTTGTQLNGAEIKDARLAAKTFDWIQTAPAVLKIARELEHEGKSKEAGDLFKRLEGLF